MTTTMTPPPAPASGGGEVPISDLRSPVRSRNRPVIAAGLLLVLLGALGGLWLVSSAGDRTDVLAVARDVPVGAELTEADLRVVALPDTPGLSPVPASELDAVVGQRAAVGLTEGSVLTQAQLTTQPLLDAGEDLVAVELARGMGPVSALDIGDVVQVVPVSEDTAEADVPATPVSSRVVEIGQANGNGDVVVHLAVDEAEATQVAGWSAAGDVALVLTEKN